VRLNENRVLFHFNDCPGETPYCRIRFDVERAAGGALNVRVTGAVVSHPSPWISPDWSEGLADPYLEIHCQGQPGGKRVRLAGRIGYFPDSENKTAMNGALLAPFEREITNPCQGPIQALTAGFEGSDFYEINRPGHARGRELRVENF
jgi:hypothetical protein